MNNKMNAIYELRSYHHLKIWNMNSKVSVIYEVRSYW